MIKITGFLVPVLIRDLRRVEMKVVLTQTTRHVRRFEQYSNSKQWLL